MSDHKPISEKMLNTILENLEPYPADYSFVKAVVDDLRKCRELMSRAVHEYTSSDATGFTVIHEIDDYLAECEKGGVMAVRRFIVLRFPGAVAGLVWHVHDFRHEEDSNARGHCICCCDRLEDADAVAKALNEMREKP